MGSLLIATGLLMYGWISCAHYSFLKESSDNTKQKIKSPNLLLQSLIWPVLKFHPDLTLNNDLEEQEA